MAIDPKLLNDLIEQQKVIVRELDRLLGPYTASMNKPLQELPELNKEAAEELRRQMEQMETTLAPYRDMSRRFHEMVEPQMKKLQDAVAAMKPQFDAMAKMASSAAETMEKTVRTWAAQWNPGKKPEPEEKKQESNGDKEKKPASDEKGSTG